MARVILNPALQTLSGDVAGFVYRRQADGSVLVARRSLPNPNREWSEAQLEQLDRFKEASARYRNLIENEELYEAYQSVLAGRGPMARLRAMVIGDILKAPRIRTIDLSGYEGAAGNMIRVLAEDNVGVARISLRIVDMTEDAEVESAEMAMNGQVSGTVEWLYAATQAVPEGHEVQVVVKVFDLAGNEVEDNALMN